MVTENVPPTDSPLLNGFQYKNIVKANFFSLLCGDNWKDSSKCKKVTNEKERKTDIEENEEKNLLLKKFENMDSIDEAESKEESFQLSPHNKLKKFALTIFL
jgi:hypothetical protein